MPQLFAQPYDIDAIGFYFETFEEFQTISNRHLNRYGDRVEEYEIQFIDGDDIDCSLEKAWNLDLSNIKRYFAACDDWGDHQKRIFIIAVGEGGYNFDPDNVSADDFEVDIYEIDGMANLAEQFVAEGLWGDIPDHLANYIDYDAIGRDLEHDYTETEIAGKTLIYRIS